MGGACYLREEVISCEEDDPSSMDCLQFREQYQIFGKLPLAREVWETPEYREWNEHLSNCRECREWRQALDVTNRGAKVEDFPCVHMAWHATFRCEDHPELWACSHAVVLYSEKFDEYSIGPRGGGGDFFHISHCPWCGVELPVSKRNL